MPPPFPLSLAAAMLVVHPHLLFATALHTPSSPALTSTARGACAGGLGWPSPHVSLVEAGRKGVACEKARRTGKAMALRGGGNDCTRGVLAIIGAIFVEVELFGKLSKHAVLPSVVTRKLTHIIAGSSMLTLFSLFPVGNSWAGRLSVALFLCGFVAVFSILAHMPEEEVAALPPFLQSRVRQLAAMACRTGDRQELAKGTLTYAAMSALLVPLLYTAPINLIALSCLYLGDGFADPLGRAFGSRPALQYRVAWFGTKSYPGSLAFLLASLSGSLVWASLFERCGHYGATFSRASFARAAFLCSAVAMVCARGGVLAGWLGLPLSLPPSHLALSCKRSRPVRAHTRTHTGC